MTIETAAEVLTRALSAGKMVLVCGNGGSFAQAQHFVGELVGTFERKDRRALPALALGSNPAVLSAVANDFGYSEVFAREMAAYLSNAGALVAISTSGRSRNVLNALEVASLCDGIRTIALTGKGCEMPAEIVLEAGTSETATIQNEHMIMLHAIARLIDRAVT